MVERWQERVGLGRNHIRCNHTHRMSLHSERSVDLAAIVLLVAIVFVVALPVVVELDRVAVD